MVHRGYQPAKAWEVFSSSGNCLNKMNKKSIHAPLLSSALPHAHTYIYGVNDASQGRGKGRQARLHDKVTANTLPEQAPEQINILPNLFHSIQTIYTEFPPRHKTYRQAPSLSSRSISTKGASTAETPPSENHTSDLYWSRGEAILLPAVSNIGRGAEQYSFTSRPI